MVDLIQELREPETPHRDVSLGDLCREAADEIERLREALYECANLARGWTDKVAQAPDYLDTIYAVACEATGEKPRGVDEAKAKD